MDFLNLLSITTIMYSTLEHSTSYVLQMGDIKVSTQPATLICVGLGSCIGVFLYDRLNKIGGGAHIMLPAYTSSNVLCTSWCYADTGLEELLIQMNAAGANIEALRAKIVGGANPSNIHTLDVGKQNIEAVMDLLIKKRIYLAACDISGNQARKALFHTYSGSVLIINEQTNFTI